MNGSLSGATTRSWLPSRTTPTLGLVPMPCDEPDRSGRCWQEGSPQGTFGEERSGTGGFWGYTDG